MLGFWLPPSSNGQGEVRLPQEVPVHAVEADEVAVLAPAQRTFPLDVHVAPDFLPRQAYGPLDVMAAKGIGLDEALEICVLVPADAFQVNTQRSAVEEQIRS